MNYYHTIASLIFLNLLSVISLLYIGNLSRDIENKNFVLNKKINLIEQQININEIEYNLYNNYEYLKKLHQIYFDSGEFNIFFNNRISFSNLQNKSLQNIHTVGM